MSTPEPALPSNRNPAAGLADIFGKFLDAILKSKGKQLGLVALLILASLAGLVLAKDGIDPEFGQIAVVVLSLVGGLAVLLTAQQNAFPAALTVWVFGLVSAYLLFAPPVPAASKNLRVAGNVRYRDTRAPVAGAIVTVEGLGGTADTTDADGFFEFRNGIPSHIAENAGDSLIFMVRHAVMEEFHTSRRGPFRFFVTPPAPSVARAGALSGRVQAWWAQSPRTGSGGPLVRVILDSIRTIQDGTSGWSSWAFDIEVNDEDDLELSHRQFNDDGGKNLVLLGSEVKVEGRPGKAIEIEIEGSRSKQFAGRYSARGLDRIAVEALRPDVPLRRRVPVSVRGNRREGDFLFHFTVVRVGAPAPVQAQRAPKGREERLL